MRRCTYSVALKHTIFYLKDKTKEYMNSNAFKLCCDAYRFQIILKNYQKQYTYHIYDWDHRYVIFQYEKSPLYMTAYAQK